MGYPGYPQQPGYQPQGGYYPRQYDAFERKGSPTLAVISAIVGLGIVGVLAWQTLALLDLIGDFAGRMPGGWTAMIIASFGIAFIALVGAVLVFARQIAGAFILLVAAILTVAAIVTAPVLAEGVGITMADLSSPSALGNSELYYHQLFEFEFDNSQATLRFVALVLGVILLIIAALPPSLNWLRRPRDNGYSAQQPGW